MLKITGDRYSFWGWAIILRPISPVIKYSKHYKIIKHLFLTEITSNYWIYPQFSGHLKKPEVYGQQEVFQCQRNKERPTAEEFKQEAVALITKKGYSMAEASRNLGVEYSILRRWKKQLADDPQNAFPGKGRLKTGDQELRELQRKLERVTEERDILKKALAYFAEDQK